MRRLFLNKIFLASAFSIFFVFVSLYAPINFSAESFKNFVYAQDGPTGGTDGGGAGTSGSSSTGGDPSDPGAGGPADPGASPGPGESGPCGNDNGTGGPDPSTGQCDPDFGTSCEPTNSCGQSNGVGTVNCDGSCSVLAPPDSECATTLGNLIGTVFIDGNWQFYPQVGTMTLSGGGTTRTSTNNPFSFNNLAPGTYTFSIVPPPSGWSMAYEYCPDGTMFDCKAAIKTGGGTSATFSIEAGKTVDFWWKSTHEDPLLNLVVDGQTAPSFSITQGRTISVFWSAQNVINDATNTCKLSEYKDGIKLRETSGVSGSFFRTPDPGSNSYILSCYDLARQAVSKTITVLVSAPLAVQCVASPQTGTVGQTITFNAQFPNNIGGGTAPYSYSWRGADGLTGFGDSVQKVYATTGNKDATVVVRDANRVEASGSCGVNITTTPSPFDVSCSFSPATAPVNTDVTWSAQIVSGGTAPFTYSWNGTDGLSGISSIIVKRYTSTGLKTGGVTVRDSLGNQDSAQCTSATGDTSVTITTPTTECSDGIDNNGDGLFDYNVIPALSDPGCDSPTDPIENYECSDGVDNTDPEDTLIDTADPGCHSDGNASNSSSYVATDSSEVNTTTTTTTQCSDGVDNDGDGRIDYPADSDCISTNDDDETNRTLCQDPNATNNGLTGPCVYPPPGTPECRDGIDNDGNGRMDCQIGNQDPGCYASGKVGVGSCNPNDTDEDSIQCADGIDNTDPEDTLIDSADPGCHSDGNASNSSSYSATDDNEVNQIPGADLIAGTPSVDSGSQNGVLRDGGTFVFRSTMRNQGSVSTNRGFNVLFQIDLGNNGGGNFDQNYLSPDGIDVGLRGDGGSLTAYSPSISNLPVGTHAIRACADLNLSFQGSINESNENNNCGANLVFTIRPITECSDGEDNDGDGRTDCNSGNSDPGCYPNNNVGSGSCNPDDTTEDGDKQCSDGRDNDGDARIDSRDPGCHRDGDPNNASSYDPNDTNEVDNAPQCTDGTDNDGDGKVDCTTGNADPQCFPDNNGGGGSCNPNDPTENIPQCSDGIDNDGNGRIDCVAGNRDPGCFPGGVLGVGSCNPNDPTESSVECANGLDDDRDGATDSADPNCHTDGNAGNPSSYDPTDDSESGAPQCSDGEDNDGDGRTDCNSGNSDPGCYPGGKVVAGQCSPSDTNEGDDAPNCSDGIDNDGDGRIDYPADTGCTGPGDTTGGGGVTGGGDPGGEGTGLECASNQGETCVSSPNSCGMRDGVVACDGRCISPPDEQCLEEEINLRLIPSDEDEKNRQLLRRGDDCTIDWVATNVDQCTIEGPLSFVCPRTGLLGNICTFFADSGRRVEGGVVVPNIQQTALFNIDCRNDDQNFETRVFSCRLNPIFIEF